MDKTTKAESTTKDPGKAAKPPAKQARDRAQLALVSACLLVAFTFFFFGPVELFLLNREEFWFSLMDVLPKALLCAGAAFLLPFALGTLLKGKARDVITCLLMGVGAALYVQGTFLNIDTGALDGREVAWSAFTGPTIVSAAIWAALLALPFVLLRYGKRLWRAAAPFVGFLLVAMQAVALAVLLATVPLARDTQNLTLVTDKMFEASSKDHIAVFVVDTMDASFLDEDLAENPAVAEALKDFAYFPYAVAGSAPTQYGIPLMLTGQYDTETLSYQAYKERAFSETPLFDLLGENGFDVRLLTDVAYLSPVLEGKVDNLQAETLTMRAPLQFVKKFYRLTAYKYFPTVARPFLWFYSGDFSEFVANETVYTFDDAAFYEKMRREGLAVVNEESTFRYYHLFGMHGPYTLDENAQRSPEGTSYAQQKAGLWKILFAYMDMLREKDLYDSATILILADHGGKELYQNPVFLIKAPHHTADTVTINEAIITFQDFVPTLAGLLGEDAQAYGRSVFDIDPQEERVTLHIAPKVLADPYMGKSYGGDRIPFLIYGNPRLRENITDDLTLAEGMTAPKELEAPQGILQLALKERKGSPLSASLAFDREGRASDLFTAGMGVLEEGYAWTDGKEGQLQMSFEEAPQSDLLFTLHVLDVFNGPQRILVYHDDQLLHEEARSAAGPLAFVVPKESVQDRTLSLRFAYPDAVSPHALGLSGDERELAFAFSALSFEPVAQ